MLIDDPRETNRSRIFPHFKAMIKHWFSSLGGIFCEFSPSLGKSTLFPWIWHGQIFRTPCEVWLSLHNQAAELRCHWTTLVGLMWRWRWVMFRSIQIQPWKVNTPQNYIIFWNPKKSWRWMESDDFPGFFNGGDELGLQPLIISGSCWFFGDKFLQKRVGGDSVEVIFWNEDVQMKTIHRGIWTLMAETNIGIESNICFWSRILDDTAAA